MSDRVAEIIQNRKQIIVDRWLEKVQKEIPEAQQEPTPITKDSVPDLLDALVEALVSDDARDIVYVSDEHGHNRAAYTQHSIAQVVREYRLLKQAIFSVTDEYGDPQKTSGRDSIMNFVDQAMEESVAVFSRIQLENRQEAEELRMSEEKFRALVEASAQIVWTTDAEGKVTEDSKSWRAFTGQTYEECRGWGWLNAVHPEDRDPVMNAWREALESESPFAGDYRAYRASTQSYQWTAVRAAPLRNVDGSVRGWVGMQTDITDRKQIEKALQLSEERQTFLLKLSDALHSLADSVEIQSTATHTAMRYFEADRCFYCEIDGDQVLIRRDAARKGLPSLAGTYAMSDMPSYKEKISTGRPIVIEDIYTSDLIEEELRQLCINLQTIAIINIPIIKNNELVGIFCVTQCQPRKWSDQEIALAQETAERTWAAVERSQAEVALHKSEEQLRLFITTSSDILYKMSADWSEIRSYYGNSFPVDTENISPSWLEAYIPEIDKPVVLKAFHEASRTKKMYELEHRYIGADGNIGWAFSRAIPLMDEEGNIVEWFGAASDITDRKKTEAALVASEENYRTLFESMEEGYIVAEVIRDDSGKVIDYRFIQINPAFERFTGLNRLQTLGKTAREVLPGLDQQWFDICQKVLVTRKTIKVEEYVEPLGEWFSKTVFRYGEEKFAVLFDNITERKQNEEALALNHLRLTTALQATKAFWAHLNLLTGEVQWSEESRQIIGMEEIRNIEDWFRLIHPEDSPRVKARGEEAIATKKDFNNEYRVVRPDGEIRWVLSTGKTLYDEHDTPYQISGLVMDITERKRNEANFAFLAEISQELATLTNIEETMEQLGESIGRYFGVQSCVFSELIEDGELSLVSYGWKNKNVPLLKGTYQIRDFLTEEQIAKSNAGEIFVCGDTSTDPNVNAESFSMYDIRSFIIIPIVHAGQWKFRLSINDNKARQWREDEVELIQEITTRIWARLERARAEEALAESEDSYRTLFESVEEGYIVAEAIRGDNGKVVDSRFLQVNPAYEKIIGLDRNQMQGKTAREVLPWLDEKWFDITQKVVDTRKTIRVDDHLEPLGEWFSMTIFHYQGEKIAVLFNNITERKQNEEALALNHLRLTTALRATKAFWAHLNLLTGEVQWSEESRQIFGYNLEEMRNIEDWLSCIHPEDRPRVEAQTEEAIAAKADFNFEYRIVSPDGEIHWVLVMGKALYDEHDTPRQLPGLVMDITERKRNEANFAFLAEISQELATLTNIEETMEQLGEFIGRYFGVQWCTFSELTENGELNRVSYGWNDESVSPLEGTYRMQDYQTEEQIKKYSDGELLVCNDTQSDPSVNAENYAACGIHSFIIVPIAHAGQWKFKLSIRDTKARQWRPDEVELIQEITTRIWARLERARAEEALAESEDSYRTLFESMEEGYIVCEAIRDNSGKVINGRYLQVNPAFEKLSGLDLGQTVGKTAREVLPYLDKKWHSICQKVVDTRQTIKVEDYNESLNKWYCITVFHYQGEKIAMLFDEITERKQNEEALRMAKQEAEQAAQAKADFLAHMSHEIRTPLNVIVGISDQLVEQSILPDLRTNLQTMHLSAQHLRVLVNDILDFSKIQAGKVELEIADVNLLALLQGLEKGHQPLAQKNKNDLQFQIDPQIPEIVRTDSLKLSQILNNLISNAIKFTQEGTITVDVSLQQQKQDTYQVTFSVQDTGIGIPSHKLDDIFATFTQADISTARQYGGSGLGLTITKSLLEVLDSRIEVESQEGKGSRFFFTLLLPEGNSDTSAGSEAVPNDAVSDLRVLVVEDVEANRQVLLYYLANWWNITPDVAINGQQAIEAAQKNHYDLILMDIRMPEIDGYQAGRAIRELPNHAHTPMLALTADTAEIVNSQPEAPFFQDVITKPLDPQELRQKLQQYSQQGELNSESE